MKVLMMMLMHGSASANDSRVDIPTKYIFSLDRHASDSQHGDFHLVGEKSITKEDQEVYSR